MNGRERVFTLLKGGKPDHLPNMPISMQFASDLIPAKYLKYATDYRVQTEGQLKAAETFHFDYVSAISDPGVEGADCGAPVVFHEDSPPGYNESKTLLELKSNLAHLKIPDPHSGRMYNRIQAIALMKERIGNDLIVEGWIEGPCAEAADLRGINTLMLDYYDDPDFVRDLFEFVLEMELQFAKAQVEAGADIIGIGDAAVSLIGPRFYRQQVWDYEKKMVDGIHEMGAKVRLHICGNTSKILKEMGTLGADIVDLDYPASMEMGRKEMGPDQVLLGNIDPVRILRNGSPELIRNKIAECHQTVGDRYIVGAGCEIPRDTSAENVRALVGYALDTTYA